MTFVVAPLAVAFVNAALLGGLGLAAAPILIHLLSRRRFRRVEWGATLFLLQAEKKNRRRVRFEQILLVALRTLAMALLALLVARPFVEPGWLATLLGGRGGVQRVIVVDDSASLAFRFGTTTDFARLRDTLLRVAAWIGRESPGDSAWVYLASQPQAEPLRLPNLAAATIDDLQARAEGWTPNAAPANPRRVVERVAADASGLSRASRVDVFVLSDFQRSDWMSGESPAQSAFEPLRKLDPHSLRVVLIDVSADPRENVAITELSFERPQIIAGQPAVVRATVANFTRERIHDVKLQPEVDGAPLPPAVVDAIEPGQTANATFEVTIAEEGRRVLAVQTSTSDGLPADDVRRIAAGVKPAIRVLLVNGAPSAETLEDEAHLLHVALSPPGQFSSGVRVDAIEPAGLDTVDLAPFDVVFLANVPAPSDAAAEMLRRYVETGGGLAIALGDNAGDGVDYNRVLHAEGRSVLPLALEGDATRVSQVEGVGMRRSAEHPVSAILPADGAAAESIHFRSFYRCVESPEATSAPAASAASASAVVIARYADQQSSAAMVEKPIGRGRVLLFTSTLDLDWNDWARAADGSYVIAMLEAVQHLARRDAAATAVVVGDELTMPVFPEEYELTASVRSPAFPDEPAFAARAAEAIASTAEPALLAGPPASRLGVYTFELNRRGLGPELRPVCVNFAPRESDLRSARSAELSLALSGIPHETLSAADSFFQDGGQTRRELWPAILLVLAIVLMTEQALAWAFGRPGRVATTVHSRLAPTPLRTSGAGA